MARIQYRTAGLRRLQVMPNLILVFSVSSMLIVVFLSLGPLLARQMPLALPQVEARIAPDAVPPSQILVRVTATQMTLNGVLISDAQLGEALASALTARGEGLVFLDIEPTLTLERVVFLMDICRQAGARSVGFTPDLNPLLNQLAPQDPALSGDRVPPDPASPETSPGPMEGQK